MLPEIKLMRFLRALTALLLICGVAHAAAPQIFDSQAGKLSVTEIATGLENPWSLAFLPDGRMLVSERPGRLRIVSAQGQVGAALSGVPAVVARGQGGLLDVVLAPDFSDSRRLYFSYSEPRPGGGNATTVAHARLTDTALQQVTVIFRQQPAIDSQQHFGSRLVFDRDGALFITLGDRNRARDRVQSLDNHIGKIVKLTADGQVPSDNPFADRDGALPEIWSYGHRNVQGAALHPLSGALWTHEHGAKGGDELNIARAGRNYGWPVISHGREYSGLKIGAGLQRHEGMEQPLHYWVPSIAPSGMAFYTADRFPAWKNSLFIGSLKFGQLVRLQLDGERVVSEERLLEGLNRRIRDIRAGPDGALYLLTDEADGAILRVEPRA
jgi:glucose/arabinose dehydrogenase